MRSIAVYSLKGGVGKTTFAANLAWTSARCGRRTLLWDLDPQGGATWLLGAPPGHNEEGHAVFTGDLAPTRLVVPSATPGLDLIPADRSLRGLDRLLFGLGKKKRLAKLLERLGRSHERIVLDCPPGLTETSEQVMRAADLIVVPVIPSPLSRRALDEVIEFLDANGLRRGALLPVFNMVDRRRTMHRTALQADSKWPIVPMASAVEATSARRQPVGALAPRSPAAQALDALWKAIDRKLARMA